MGVACIEVIVEFSRVIMRRRLWPDLRQFVSGKRTLVMITTLDQHRDSIARAVHLQKALQNFLAVKMRLVHKRRASYAFYVENFFVVQNIDIDSSCFSSIASRSSMTSCRLIYRVSTFVTNIHLLRPQARILAREYKELPEKEMRKWEKKAEQDKFRYQEEMKDYVPIDDPTGGGGKKKAKKVSQRSFFEPLYNFYLILSSLIRLQDPLAPKRNMSAYFLFSIDERPRVKEENPEASFGDIARLISQRFKSLSASERKIWDAKAAEDKERYARQMSEFQG